MFSERTEPRLSRHTFLIKTKLKSYGLNSVGKKADRCIFKSSDILAKDGSVNEFQVYSFIFVGSTSNSGKKIEKIAI